MSKYIIDVGEAYVKHICGKGDMLCLPVRINEFEDNWLNTNIPLTPYTEPDIEKVREEVYRQGYDAACKDIDIKSKINAAYRKGLDDAWEAVKKLARMNTDTSESITGQFGLHNIMHNLTAYEAIKKIRQYEQKEKITKGDVVRLKSAPEVEILVTYADEEYVGGMALTEVDDSCKIGDQYTDIRIHKVEKTGRHYEIAEVLQKMKE